MTKEENFRKAAELKSKLWTVRSDNAKPEGLERYISAQEGVWEIVLPELRAGEKRGHWMWYIFPQIAGLGSSSMSRRYAIGDLAEAREYLAHPVLGARLREAIVSVRGSKNGAVLGRRHPVLTPKKAKSDASRSLSASDGSNPRHLPPCPFSISLAPSAME